jgi:hypothetical protein
MTPADPPGAELTNWLVVAGVYYHAVRRALRNRRAGAAGLQDAQPPDAQLMELLELLELQPAPIVLSKEEFQEPSQSLDRVRAAWLVDQIDAIEADLFGQT